MRWALPAVIAGSALFSFAAVASPERLWDRGFQRAFAAAPPFPADAPVIAAGRELYRQRCLACHGERGRGDGPAGEALRPPPADLLLHVPQHTDGELYFYISHGVPGTAMPAWRSVLSVRERWTLVHYLREIGAGRP